MPRNAASGLFTQASIKMALNKSKRPEDVLQEEFLRERAAVLGRTGDSVSRALEKLRSIESSLEERMSRWADIERLVPQDLNDARNLGRLRRQMVVEINREISRFNRVREYALMRHYYLIVTREAMGMRRHHWVDQHYRVPPRKKHLQDD
jgi:hypothetical protein